MKPATPRRSSAPRLDLAGLSANDCRELAMVLVRLSHARATFTARGADALARAADELLRRAAAQPTRARRPGPGPAPADPTPDAATGQRGPQPSDLRI